MKKLFDVEIKLKVSVLAWTRDDAKAIGLSKACSTPLVKFDVIGTQAFDQSEMARAGAMNAGFVVLSEQIGKQESE